LGKLHGDLGEAFLILIAQQRAASDEAFVAAFDQAVAFSLFDGFLVVHILGQGGSWFSCHFGVVHRFHALKDLRVGGYAGIELRQHRGNLLCQSLKLGIGMRAQEVKIDAGGIFQLFTLVVQKHDGVFKSGGFRIVP